MTVSSTTVKNSYSGNGSTTQFAYGFKIFADSDLIVIIRSSTGTETVKTLTTHYTVAGAGDASGGSITFTSGNTPASGETVVIIREVPQTQAIDYIANDPFPAESHEEGLDRATMTTQQVQEEVDRSLKLSRTNTMTSTEFTVGATDRANKVLSFDSSGELSVTQELGTFRGNWSASTAYQVRDLVKDTSTNNIFMANTAHTSSGSQPLTSNTDSAKWDLIVDAATATTSSTSAANSATAAANSATASANSATASANSASAASTSETNAATSASTSSTQATNSANSATASANSAAAAEATFDLFDDSYLGAKSSDPTVDNDGNALQDGALYFDTTNNVMKVYDLGTTTWLQLTPTVSNQNNINSAVANASNINAAVANESNINAAVSNASNINSVVSNASNINSVAGISTAITNVNNNSSNINAVNANSANINLTAGSIGNVNNVGGSIANVNSVASNLASVNNFGEVYRISSSAPTTSLNSGDLYFDTTTNILNVYGASGWQNAGSSVNGTSQRYNYTATNAQTTFTGSDNAGNTLAYDAGYIDVYLNGVKLLNGTDVTVTSGSSVVLASGATTGDVVDIVAYGTFSVASLNADNLDSGTVPDARITGAYTGITNLTMSGDLTVDTNTLFVKSSNDRVGIGNSNPQNKLDITALTWDDGLTIKNTGNFNVGIIGDANRSGAGGGLLNLQARWNGTEVSGILFQAGSDTTNKDDGEIVFRTASAGTPTERAKITNSGNLLVGKSSSSPFGTSGHEINANGEMFITRTGTPLNLNRNNSDGRILNLLKDGTAVGQIDSVNSVGIQIVSGSSLDLYSDNANGVRIDSTGRLRPINDNSNDLGNTNKRWNDLWLGGGLYVGGTGTANKLDDYEEGTWSPAITTDGGGGNSGVTYGDRYGTYTKIGRIVTVHVFCNLDAVSSFGTGNAIISTLPFSSNSASQYRSGVVIGYAKNWNNAPSGGTISTNANTIYLRKRNSTSALSNFTDVVQVGDMNTDSEIILTATYETD